MVYKVGSNANTVIDNGQSGQANTSNGFFNNVYYTTEFRSYAPGGQNYGYASGGTTGTGVLTATINRWPFAASTVNAVSPGNLSTVRSALMGTSSFVNGNGYSNGGFNPPAVPSAYNIIERFPMLSTTTSISDVGDMTAYIYGGTSNSSDSYGYVVGGISGTPTPKTTNIQRYPFSAATTNATDVGTLGSGMTNGFSSKTAYAAYHSGHAASPYLFIQRFPFASESPSVTNIGNLAGTYRADGGGQSSATHAYQAGGSTTITPVANLATAIDRYSFATDSVTASNVGNLAQARKRVGQGISSLDFGYVAGGEYNPAAPTFTSNIERFPFASATPSGTSVGNLTAARWLPGTNEI